MSEITEAEFENVNDVRNQEKQLAMKATTGRVQSIANLASQLLIGGVEKFGLTSMKTEHVLKAFDLAEEFSIVVQKFHAQEIGALEQQYADNAKLNLVENEEVPLEDLD